MAKNWIIESAVETDEIVLNDAGSAVDTSKVVILELINLV